MSKIINILLLVSVVCTATATASAAASQEPNLNALSSLAITKVVANTAVVKNTSVIGNSDIQYSVSQDMKTSESSLPATGWLLLSALIGFVLLSNRWSV